MDVLCSYYWRGLLIVHFVDFFFLEAMFVVNISYKLDISYLQTFARTSDLLCVFLDVCVFVCLSTVVCLCKAGM